MSATPKESSPAKKATTKKKPASKKKAASKKTDAKEPKIFVANALARIVANDSTGEISLIVLESPELGLQGFETKEPIGNVVFNLTRDVLPFHASSDKLVLEVR